MKPGAIFAYVLSAVGLTAVVTAFLTNASPYVTVAQAATMSADNLHLAGDIVPGTVQVSPHSKRVTFTLKDAEGRTMPVLYRGAPPANMGSATKVVAVGGVKDGVFACEKLLLKCPSKYESEGGAS